ncbi:MAG: 3-dehydroquinate synthase [Acidobacteriia bacterium]|nr:3-dehydroquinate synthase [Terriglobia bacterium]
MIEIQVPIATRRYSIILGRGEATENPALKSLVKSSTKVFLITNRTIWGKYSQRVRSKGSILASAVPLLIPDGERFKNMRWYQWLCRELVRRGADRKSLIVALGGGVVGDLAGFVASSVLRGLPLAQIPTSLLAQIDSSIGGKTAVNLPEGKNMVGAFYQPALVVTDPLFLKTLPPRELRAGLYEAIKYGVIEDRELFAFIESRIEDLLQCDLKALETVIRHCAFAKAAIVGKDERESGIRKTLNFGHTLGHALEAGTSYRRFKHGEAVAWGMLMATRLAEKLSLMSPADSRRVVACIGAAGPLPRISDLAADTIFKHMRHDKKAIAGKLQLVLPTEIGSVKVVEGVDAKMIRGAYREIQNESLRDDGAWSQVRNSRPIGFVEVSPVSQGERKNSRRRSL